MSNGELELSPEYINTLPVLNFEGAVKLVSSADELDNIIDNLLMREECIGFDTESRPSFAKGKVYPISIIQLATLSTVYIVQFKSTGFTDGLARLFESNVEIVGLGLKDDFMKLRQSRAFTANNAVDLSEIAKKKGFHKSNLRYLSAKYLGKRIVKTAQTTNWARTNLTERQIRYAATDAWACLLIRPFLEADIV